MNVVLKHLSRLVICLAKCMDFDELVYTSYKYGWYFFNP